MKKSLFALTFAVIVLCYCAGCGSSTRITVYNWRDEANLTATGRFDYIETFQMFSDTLGRYEREKYSDHSQERIDDNVEIMLKNSYKKYTEEYFESKKLVLLSILNPDEGKNMDLEVSGNKINKDGLMTITLKKIKAKNPFIEPGAYVSFTFIIEVAAEVTAFVVVIK